MGTSPGQLYDGVLMGSDNVPVNGFTIEWSSVFVGCSATGPAVAKSFTGSYDAGTGMATGNANQPFTVTSTGCPVTSTRLSSASLTADPVIDLQW
ncbi:hypothetical protein ACFQ3F_14085 [Nocardioides ginsengisoli]|uniref:Ig-like domain-containing protein n=1 Tax=Nocardioides ginsengisoli TaxID=363868 RepID=A0ABW3W2Y1_9ACTN